eukprot:TRINITY_DN20433_c0_g1_i1.p1 TRINITY_DN20433_c0_g1~~TRINITY_DN20433_c0_g1_i1.p1  ORF type:complete len:455 (+),score=78.92 TRINITY_DN20433_c0_g1_i1:63-1427(+)
MCPLDPEAPHDMAHFEVINKTPPPPPRGLEPGMSPSMNGRRKRRSDIAEKMLFTEAGWPEHVGEGWVEWSVHKAQVAALLLKWAVQLIVTAGPVRLARWLWLLGRILSFVLLLLVQVFLPMAWHYCTSGCILRDVPYTKNPDLQGRGVLDIYLPEPAYSYIAKQAEGQEKRKHPVAIFLVGGAWIVGYKAWGALLARLLSAAGVVCFMPDYRNFPQATISDMVDDVDDAVAWVLANLEVYGGDPENVILIGQSAGAHLGLTALLGQVQNSSKWSPSAIRSFVGISGPYDIVNLTDFFDSRGLYKYVVHLIFEHAVELHSPVSILNSMRSLPPSFPPTYLFHGTADNSVPPWSSTRLASVLKAKGAQVTCKLLHGHTHTAPIIESPVGGSDPLMADLLHLFCNGEIGKLPPTGGFEGTMKEVMENSEGDKLGSLSKLVPRAGSMVLRLARLANPF